MGVGTNGELQGVHGLRESRVVGFSEGSDEGVTGLRLFLLFRGSYFGLVYGLPGGVFFSVGPMRLPFLLKLTLFTLFEGKEVRVYASQIVSSIVLLGNFSQII